MSTAARSAKSTRRPLTIAAVAVAVTLGLLAAVIVPLSASAGIASITGKVTLPTGSAASGVSVQAIRTFDNVVVGNATVSSSGSFSISGLASPEGYTLKFGASSTTFAQYLGGTSDYDFSQQITLVGNEASAVVVSLQAAGTASGTVKNTAGTAISGATATLYKRAGASWTSIRTATTTSSGYKITGIEPGEYVIKISKTGYPAVFSGNSASLASATVVGIVAKKTTTTNFTIGTSAKVSGVVSGDLGTPAPLAGVSVQAIRYIGSPGAYTGVEKVGAPVTTAANGSYTIGTLPPGDYTLFFDPSSDTYGSNYLGTTAETGSATVFSVSSGATVTGKNITLVGSATIIGSFKEGTTPIPNARVDVTAYTSNPDSAHVMRTVFTDGLGEFTVNGLGPGHYRVNFGSFSDTDPSDGVAENNDYRRKTTEATIVSGGTGILDVLSTPRTAPVANTAAAFDTADFTVGHLIITTDPIWSASSSSPFSTLTSQWYREGVLIAGATSYQYTPRAADFGHTLTYRATFNDWELGSTWSETAASPSIAEGDSPTIISGHSPFIDIVAPHVGDTLTLDLGQWEDVNSLPDVDLGLFWEIAWERSSDGSTWTFVNSGTSHLVTSNDYLSGPYLRASMRGERRGYADANHYVYTAAIEPGTFAFSKKPTVKTTTSAYSISSNGTWSPTPSSFEYEWLIYDEDLNQVLPAPTTASISRAGLAGKYVLVTVTPIGANVSGGAINIPVQSGKIHTTTATNAITGDPRVGEVLTAPAYVWKPGADTTTHKWQYLSGTTWKTIPAVTASTYQVGASYKGKKIRVITTATTAGFGSTAKTSAATAAVTTGFAPVVVDVPTYSDIVAATLLVTVDPGTWSPSATSYSYQWRSRTTDLGARTNITGATKSTYTIPTSLVSKYLDVLITVKRTGHTNATYILNLGQVIPTVINTVKPTYTVTQEANPGNGNTIETLLSATGAGTWNPNTGLDIQYQWFSISDSGVSSFAANGQTYFSDSSNYYSPVDLVVTASKAGYESGVARVAVKNGKFFVNDSPLINLDFGGQVGSGFHASLPTFSSPPDGYVTSIQWQQFVSGQWTNISGATSADFVPTASVLGRQIRITTTTTAARYDTLIATSDPVTVVIANQAEAGSGANAPSFSAEPRVGTKSTYSTGTWTVSGLTFAYEWQIADGNVGFTFDPIAGATTSAYTATEADVDRWIRLKVTATKAGYESATWLSTPTQVHPGTIKATTLPKVTRVGYTLNSTAGVWSQASLTGLDYEWRRYSADGSSYSVVGSNAATYNLVPADEGRFLQLAVTATKAPAWGPTTVIVVAQVAGAVRPSGAITVTGGTNVGNTMTLNIPGWNQDSPTVSQQWYRNGIAIAGQTGLSHTVVSADLGKKLTVKVTATRVGFSTFTATLAAGMGTSSVVPVNLTAPTVTPSQYSQVDSTLTATPGTWSVSSMTFSYQWYRGAFAIAGATSSSYTASVADIGNDLRVKVTASRAGFASASALSTPHTITTGDAPTQSGPLSLSLVSGVLKPNTITWDMPVTLTYQWRSSTDNGATYNNIAGATGNTLSLTGLSAGTYVVLQITASRPGHTSFTLENLTEYIVLP